MKDARRYEELAEYARGRGYPDVTGPAVQQWVKRGLLPRAEPRPYGFGQRGFSYSAKTGPQVLTLCRLRYAARIRDLEAIAMALWFEGYDLPAATVRQALFHAVDVSRAARMGQTLTARRGEDGGSSLDDVGTFAAAVVAPNSNVLGGVHTTGDAADLTQGITDHVARSLGVADGPPDPAGIDALGRAAGLTSAGAGQLPAVADSWRPEAARAAIDTASLTQLAAARAGALIAAAALETVSAAPSALTLVETRQLHVLLAASFLVLRDHPAARDVLAANEAALASAKPGAPALRYV